MVSSTKPTDETGRYLGAQTGFLPLDKTGQRLPGLIKAMQLVVIAGGPHAIAWTHAAQVNTALLDFLRN